MGLRSSARVLLNCGRVWAPLNGRGAMQIRFISRCAVAKSPTVDREVLHDALDIVARLREGNPLNPIDGVDLAIAWITVLCHPLLDSAAAGIVTRKGQNEGAAIVLEQCGDFTSTHLRIVDRVGDLAPGRMHSVNRWVYV